jgi:hypothetical protein
MRRKELADEAEAANLITSVSDIGKLTDSEIRLQLKAWKFWANKKNLGDGLDFKLGSEKKAIRVARLTAVIHKLGAVADQVLLSAGYRLNIEDDLEAASVAEMDPTVCDVDTDEDDDDGEAIHGRVDNRYSGGETVSSGQFC